MKKALLIYNSPQFLASPSQTFIGQNDVLVGDGYPQAVGDGNDKLKALIFINPQSNNPLCAAGEPARRKRDAGNNYDSKVLQIILHITESTSPKNPNVTCLHKGDNI